MWAEFGGKSDNEAPGVNKYGRAVTSSKPEGAGGGRGFRNLGWIAVRKGPQAVDVANVVIWINTPTSLSVFSTPSQCFQLARPYVRSLRSREPADRVHAGQPSGAQNT